MTVRKDMIFIFIAILLLCVAPRWSVEWCARMFAHLSSQSFVAGWVKGLRAKKEKKED